LGKTRPSGKPACTRKKQMRGYDVVHAKRGGGLVWGNKRISRLKQQVVGAGRSWKRRPGERRGWKLPENTCGVWGKGGRVWTQKKKNRKKKRARHVQPSVLIRSGRGAKTTANKVG